MNLNSDFIIDPIYEPNHIYIKIAKKVLLNFLPSYQFDILCVLRHVVLLGHSPSHHRRSKGMHYPSLFEEVVQLNLIYFKLDHEKI